MTTDDHMRAAWSALLRGDTAERDRQCDLAKAALIEEEREEVIRAATRVMSVDFYVKADGTVIPTSAMTPRA